MVGGEAEDRGDNQPPRTSWWQQSFSCSPCPRPESGHQAATEVCLKAQHYVADALF